MILCTSGLCFWDEAEWLSSIVTVLKLVHRVCYMLHHYDAFSWLRLLFQVDIKKSCSSLLFVASQPCLNQEALSHRQRARSTGSKQLLVARHWRRTSSRSKGASLESGAENLVWGLAVHKWGRNKLCTIWSKHFVKNLILIYASDLLWWWATASLRF
jgi:hypothetical protein